MSHVPQGSFAKFANSVASRSGRPAAFMSALGLVLVWAIAGPAFHFSAAWQMVVNTGTTIVTFLMVFLLQNSQNRDNVAVQAKLDEIILATTADNRFVGVENLDEPELQKLMLNLLKRAATTEHESPLDDAPT